MKLNRFIYTLGLLFFLGYQPFVLFAQATSKKHIDSVLLEAKNQEPSEKRKSYLLLGDRIILKNTPDAATPLFEYLLKKDTTSYAKMMLYEAYSKNLSRRGYLDESIALKHEGAALALKLNNNRRYVFYNIALGFSYDQKNKPDLALEYLTRVEDLVQQEESIGLLPNFYHAKSAVYNSLKDYAKQEYYLLEMYEIIKDIPNNPNKRFYLYMVLDYYAQVDNPGQLAKFTEIMAQHYEDANPNTPKGHMPIAALFKRRLSAENIPVLVKAIQISDSLNNINSLVATTIALANIYEANGQPRKGIDYLQAVVAKLETVDKPAHLIDAYTLLSSMSAKANNYKDAYDYKILQASLQDSVTSENMQRNIAEIEIEFETEKKERKILEQNLQIEKQEQQKKQIRNGLIALGILALLVFLFYRYRLQSQKTIAQQTQSIQAQKITELQQKNKLLALNSMIEGQEAERLRIAKDLHDSLGGLLSTVKAHFTTIQNEIQQIEGFNLTEKTNKLIDEAVIEVRRISHNMMPQALSISGLKGAVEDLGLQLQQEGYKTTVEIVNISDTIDATKEVMLYRLLQELLNNIRKHAEAKEITIQLIGHVNELTLIVEDDGKGFDYKQQLANSGIGLKSINSRVQYLDGTIVWDSEMQRGTTISVSVPI